MLTLYKHHEGGIPAYHASSNDYLIAEDVKLFIHVSKDDFKCFTDNFADGACYHTAGFKYSEKRGIFDDGPDNRRNIHSCRRLVANFH